MQMGIDWLHKMTDTMVTLVILVTQMTCDTSATGGTSAHRRYMATLVTLMTLVTLETPMTVVTQWSVVDRRQQSQFREAGNGQSNVFFCYCLFVFLADILVKIHAKCEKI
jgi:hypothetical protein